MQIQTQIRFSYATEVCSHRLFEVLWITFLRITEKNALNAKRSIYMERNRCSIFSSGR
jgi:hypothetical protein